MSEEITRLPRAYTVDQLLNMRFKALPFEGDFLASFGKPEPNGVWLVYGESANGKTSFLLQLARYLANFGRVAYNTIEEGARLSFQEALKRNYLQGVGNKVLVLNREGLPELRLRLSKRRSPKFIIIDSLQYLQLDRPGYQQLKNDYPDKLFIFNSHAKGKRPTGRLAEAILFDADVKIRVEGYRAKFDGRFGGGANYDIWKEGAAKYYNEF